MPATIIRNKVSKEYKNLACIIRECGKNQAVKIVLTKLPAYETCYNEGILTIHFADDTIAQAKFASYGVMQWWVNNRRNLKGVAIETY